MTDVIETKRLKLRRYKASDAADITRLIGDWDVVKWLTAVPYPYTLSDAKEFIGDPMSKETFGLILDGRFAGGIGLHTVSDGDHLELGYWLGKPYWGQGLMTEAAQAVVADHFAQSDDNLTSGYLVGNQPSQNVLSKLGFVNTELLARYCRSQAKELPLQRMQMTKDRWRHHHE